MTRSIGRWQTGQRSLRRRSALAHFMQQTWWASAPCTSTASRGASMHTMQPSYGGAVGGGCEGKRDCCTAARPASLLLGRPPPFGDRSPHAAQRSRSWPLSSVHTPHVHSGRPAAANTSAPGLVTPPPRPPPPPRLRPPTAATKADLEAVAAEAAAAAPVAKFE